MRRGAAPHPPHPRTSLGAVLRGAGALGVGLLGDALHGLAGPVLKPPLRLSLSLSRSAPLRSPPLLSLSLCSALLRSAPLCSAPLRCRRRGPVHRVLQAHSGRVEREASNGRCGPAGGTFPDGISAALRLGVQVWRKFQVNWCRLEPLGKQEERRQKPTREKPSSNEAHLHAKRRHSLTAPG